MKLRYAFPLLALLCTALSGCEEVIKHEDRYKPAPIVAERMVLIEEYTGMYCSNCPAGHAMLRDIEATYNTTDNLDRGVGVISVGIHIPQFGFPVDDGGLVTPEARTLSNNQTTAPAARVSRRGAVIENTALWQSEVAKRIIREPIITFNPVKLEVKGGHVEISGSIKSLSANPIDNATFHVWIVEDDIVAEQLQPDGTYDANYVHHGVYRASANGLNGEKISLIPRGTYEYKTVPYPLHKNWNPANLRAVVFVETDADGVLNSAQSSLINE